MSSQKKKSQILTRRKKSSRGPDLARYQIAISASYACCCAPVYLSISAPVRIRRKHAPVPRYNNTPFFSFLFFSQRELEGIYIGLFLSRSWNCMSQQKLEWYTSAGAGVVFLSRSWVCKSGLVFLSKSWGVFQANRISQYKLEKYL